MTQFAIGQRVRALVTAQGLNTGWEYLIRSIQTRHTFLGGYTTYQVESIAQMVSGETQILSIGNGHLILSAVES